MRKLFHIGDIVTDSETPWTGPLQVIEVNYKDKTYRLRALKSKRTFKRGFFDKYLKLDRSRNG